jgi:hypothetical protein
MTGIDEKIAALEAKIAGLQGEIAALKDKAGSADISFKDGDKPKTPWPKYDPTERMSMPGSAMKAMVDLIPDTLKKGGFDAHSWAQTKSRAEPGGFGPGPDGDWNKGPTKVRPEEELKVPEPKPSWWSNRE